MLFQAEQDGNEFAAYTLGRYYMDGKVVKKDIAKAIEHLEKASACYQGGQDPFRQNCPVHFNTDHSHPLPAGDTHILYPGEDGPWLSARSEAQRESAEEYEMLKALAKKDKARADSICAKVFRSFCDVEYDVAKFRAARRELLEALSE